MADGGQPLRVLCLEDSPSDAELESEALTGAGYQVDLDLAEDRAAFERLLVGELYDIILADFSLPGFDAHGALELAKAACPGTPFICVSGTIGEETTVELLKQGADDVVLKGRLARLPFAVQRAIDDRARAQTLVESEQRFRFLFEHLVNGYAYCRMIYDDAGQPADFVYLDVNPAFELLTGLKDVVGRPVSEVIPGLHDLSPEVFEVYGRVARTGKTEVVTFDVKPLDLWVFVTVYSAEPGYFVTLFEDVTERRRTLEDLRESEQRLRDVIFSAGDWVWEVDEKGVYTYSSRKGFELFGSDDVIGRTPFSFMPPGEAERVAVIFRGIMADKAPIKDLENWVVTKTGDKACLLTNGVPVLNDEGGLKGYRGVDKDITARKQAEEEVRHQAQRLRRALEGTVLAMSQVVESRDPYTAGHERRVAELATAIAAQMGIDGEALEALRHAALIHDVGKIAVPAEILAKPGRLSAVEFELIKQHPAAGFEILTTIDFGRPVAEIVLQHHERLDGSGYPRALAGEAILPEARILAVADVVEAMSSHRPYRAALGMEAALAEIRAHAGVKYDADVVAACIRLVEEQGFVFIP